MDISATGLMGLIGAVVLTIVLAYSLFRNRNRSPRNERIAEAATREEYRHPDSYNPKPFRDGLVRNPDGSMPNTK
jgi:hypothetical protein